MRDINQLVGVKWVKCALTYRRIIAVREGLIRSFAHEHPLITLKLAFDDFAVQIAKLSCDFDFGEW